MRIVGVVCGLVFVLAGVAAGSLSLTGVEPPGLAFVDCGPAVFGRPDPLPAPECADAYTPMTFLTWAGIVVGVGTVVCSVLVGRRRSTVTP